VFRDLGVPKRLLTLVEGESLLNDGVAIVLAQVLVVLALGGAMTVEEAVLDFVLVFFGGALVGLVIGALAALLLPVLERLPAAALSIAVAYGGFVLAEEVFGFSGVMATLMAGVMLGGLLDSRADPSVRTLLHEFWGALAFIANALLFLFVGLALDIDLLVANWAAVLLAIGAALIARPLAIVPTVRLLERAARIPRIGPASSAVLIWGGLRGGVALALALALPDELAQRELFIAMTGGVVLTTLLVNATTMSPLIRALGLDQPDDEERYLDALARLVAIDAVRTRLERLAFNDELVDAHLAVAAADAHDQLGRARLSSDEEVTLLTMRGLTMERETYQDLSDAGLLPPISTRTLTQEIDDELEELQYGGLEVDAARRGRLGWLGRVQRRVLGLFPPPIGENLADVGYVEVAARRLAALRAALELQQFKTLREVEQDSVDRAKDTFLHWERAAATTLAELDARSEIDELTLRRRQAKAVGRITTSEVLRELVDRGMLPAGIAATAEARIAEEIDQIGT
jgi:monovalent cation:H+ antiporter, CPA1 family